MTRSQQWAANNKAKKHSLRQSRSSGSDTEANGEIRKVAVTEERRKNNFLESTCYIHVMKCSATVKRRLCDNTPDDKVDTYSMCF